MPTYHDRYAARLRAFVSTWSGHNMAHIAYLSGRKARSQGRSRGWSYAGVLTYPAQRLARLGYVDEARGLPDRLERERWQD
jgi:hypothetical protein